MLLTVELNMIQEIAAVADKVVDIDDARSTLWGVHRAAHIIHHHRRKILRIVIRSGTNGPIDGEQSRHVEIDVFQCECGGTVHPDSRTTLVLQRQLPFAADRRVTIELHRDILLSGIQLTVARQLDDQIISLRAEERFRAGSVQRTAEPLMSKMVYVFPS